MKNFVSEEDLEGEDVHDFENNVVTVEYSHDNKKYAYLLVMNDGKRFECYPYEQLEYFHKDEYPEMFLWDMKKLAD